MTPTEIHYHTDRGRYEQHQTLDIIQEAGEPTRGYIRFRLMEQRWRSPQEAADYLRWAAGEIETLE